MSNRSEGSALGKLIALAIVAVIVLFLALASVANVNAGFVGVVTTWGKVEPGTLAPGFHMIVPVAQQMHQVETRVQPHEFKQISAASAEMQTVILTGKLNYHLDGARANELYQVVGLDFAGKVIDPALSDYLKEVVPQFKATEVLPSRDKIRSLTKEKLNANLGRYGMVVDDVYIANVDFSGEYQAAIEGKQTAQQNVEKEQQILAQKTIQAQQAVAQAKGEADAKVVRAEGDAKANQLLAQSLSSTLIQYLQTTKWDGKLPQVTSGAVPLLNLNP